jgi:hypothetical protein
MLIGINTNFTAFGVMDWLLDVSVGLFVVEELVVEKPITVAGRWLFVVVEFESFCC